jgi:predicted nucleic acid-binding protein
MEAIIDTSAIISLVDRSSEHHHSLADIINKDDYRLIIPSPVIPEACYMLNKKFGISVEIQFIEEIISVNFHIEIIKFLDLARIVEILKKYNSLDIGYVDGAIVAIAERLKINRIFTLDRKHFNSLIPLGFDYFEIYPA